MPTPDSIAGDVISAATFLAGLILLYISSLNVGFGTYTTEQKSSVKKKFRRRGWIAFWILIIAVASVPLALASEWLDSGGLLIASVVTLILAFIGGVVAAGLSVDEMK